MEDKKANLMGLWERTVKTHSGNDGMAGFLGYNSILARLIMGPDATSRLSSHSK